MPLEAWTLASSRTLRTMGKWGLIGPLLANIACSTVSGTSVLSSAADRASEWYLSLKRRLIGSAEFKASDGKYFPPFIYAAFPKSTEFTSANPTVNLARQGVKLIEVRTLSKTGDSDQNESNLSWSSDGAHLGFEITTFNTKKILLADLSGTLRRELSVQPNRKDTFLDGMVSARNHSYNSGLRWSTSGSNFTFMSNGGNGAYNIYVGSIDDQEKPVTSGKSKDGYASWNPINSEIAFVSSRSGNGDIYVVDSRSRAMERISESSDVDIFPEWSPDGNSIVYSSGDSSRHEILISQRIGRSWRPPEPVTNWKRDSLRPTFSPDGRLLAFYSEAQSEVGENNASWNLHVLELNSGDPIKRANAETSIVARDVLVDLNTGPAWTPDGRKLLFVQRSSGSFNPIHVYDLFSGENIQLPTRTRMNRDLMMSNVGVLSFRAQEGAWEKVYVALTNLGRQLQKPRDLHTKIHYLQ